MVFGKRKRERERKRDSLRACALVSGQVQYTYLLKEFVLFYNVFFCCNIFKTLLTFSVNGNEKLYIS